jgi:hypothetical protein
VARIIAFPFNLKGHLLSQNRALMETEAEFEQEALWPPSMSAQVFRGDKPAAST